MNTPSRKGQEVNPWSVPYVHTIGSYIPRYRGTHGKDESCMYVARRTAIIIGEVVVAVGS